MGNKNQDTTTRALIVIPNEDFQDESLNRFGAKMDEVEIITHIAAPLKKTCTGMLGSKIEPDFALLNVDPAIYAALFFVGGEGTKNLWEDYLAISLAQTFDFAKKYIFACNTAPMILARAQLLKQRKATCAEAYRSELENMGAEYVSDHVAFDQNILTGQGSPICDEFIKKAVALLTEPVPKKS